jgi:protein-tyrosine kinase
MELRQCVIALPKRWWRMVVIVAVAAVFSYLDARATPRSHLASTVWMAFAIGLVRPGGARQALDLTALGSLPRTEGKDPASKLVVIKHPRSPVAEAYRVLHTNLKSAAADCPLQTLVITSPMLLEGKSVTAANLAVIIAQSGKRVILVDADLRHPNQHRIFELDNQAGLSNALREDIDLSRAVQAAPVENLRVLPSGPLPDRPFELLDPKRLRELAESLQQHADVVIVDYLPVAALADAKSLATRLGGTLLIVDSSNTPRSFVQRGKDALNKVGAQLPGAALDHLPSSSEDYYYYRYYSVRGPSLSSTDLDLPTRSFGQADSFLEPIIPATIEKADHVIELDARPFAQAVRSEAISTPIPVARPVQAGNKLVAPLLGAGALVILVVVFVLSLIRQQEQRIGYEATRAAAAQTVAVDTPRVNQTATAAAQDPARRQTEIAQTRAATSAVLAKTADAGAATQQAISAATRQAMGFAGCETIELDILQSPNETQNTETSSTDIELTWRVRNKTTLPNCTWGQVGQETQLLRAIEVSGQGNQVPVRLRWIQGDEYDLSLIVALNAGEHTLIWRLIPPATQSPRGPDLPARVNVVVPTPTPTATLQPTPTPRPTATLQPTPTSCRVVTYDCNCRQVCAGRDCTRECDQCEKEKCD